MILPYTLPWGFPGGPVVKNLPDNAGGAIDAGLISGSGDSSQYEIAPPLHYSCLGRSLVGYSPWGSRESDMTE